MDGRTPTDRILLVYRWAIASVANSKRSPSDGDARVYVNGTRVDPSEYGGDSSQTVTVVGNGTYSEYEFESGARYPYSRART